jgi:hypothetical protein
MLSDENCWNVRFTAANQPLGARSVGASGPASGGTGFFSYVSL